MKRDTLEIHSEKRVTLKTINNIRQSAEGTRLGGWGFGLRQGADMDLYMWVF